MTLSHMVVLDLDGVLIKSNFIKYRAMLSLFESVPERNDKISAFILANGGVPRKEKITSILENILGIPAAPTVLADYLTRYHIKLEGLLHSAPLVEGVAEFVARGDYTFYVSSSAPESEVESQLARTGLLSHFCDVFGGDTPKASALSEVKHRHKDCMPVFFGDSAGDLRAAQEANVAFVAVVCERDNFAACEVVKIQDFTSIQFVQRCIDDVVDG